MTNSKDIEKGIKKKKIPVDGLILAGGRGRRMANQDKGLILVQGQRLVEKQIDWLKPQVNRLWISANRNIEIYQSYDYPIITDDNKSFPGPLEGVYQGLKHTTSDWLFVIPVDVPFLPENVICSMYAMLTPLDRLVFLKSNQREQYLIMLINRSLLDELKNYNLTGQKRVQDFLKQVNARAIDIGISEKAFANLNRPEDFS